MTIIITKELEYTKQVMHNAIAHHLLTDAQLVPEQRSTPSRPTPPSLYTGHDVTWYGIPLLTSLGQLPWLCPLPTSCAPPAFLLAGHEKLKNPSLLV